MLDLRGAMVPRPPADFTTGCYVLQDQVPGLGACRSRVTHAALDKDRGLIDPVDGRATEPVHDCPGPRLNRAAVIVTVLAAVIVLARRFAGATRRIDPARSGGRHTARAWVSIS
jgi:hypothetical protein